MRAHVTDEETSTRITETPPADGLDGALQAAEATLNRRPEIDYLLVADRAEVVSGKLYLMGGSWDRITPPQFPHRMMLGHRARRAHPVHVHRRAAHGQRRASA